ncbi:MAG TPA: DUF2239 family protein [Gemmatimonadales bacterium]|nr:DUF2239 family protein [Gemmatimonadales bacterium]
MTASSPALPPSDAIAFLGHRCVARGPIADVAAALRTLAAAPTDPPLLVFDAVTSAPIDLDLRGTEAEVRARVTPGPGPRVEAEPPRGPGRPRLGVVSKEITLLPRHWTWLGQQRGGASATIRRLIDAERSRDEGPARRRRAREVAYQFMSHLAGNLPGFEDATRALFGGHARAFRARVAAWPTDVGTHLTTLTADAFVEDDG